MSQEALIYLGLCAGAIVFACHASKDQRLASVTLAIGLLTNWLLVEWTYAGAASPQATLRGWGMPASAVDLWAIFDLSLGVLAIVTGRTRWWGWAIYGLCLAQVMTHVLRVHFTDATYTFWLDKMLLAQVAVFVLLGGRGVSDRMFSLLGLRRLGRASKRGLAKVVES